MYKLQYMNVLLKSARPYSRTIKELTKNQAIQNGEKYGFEEYMPNFANLTQSRDKGRSQCIYMFIKCKVQV